MRATLECDHSPTKLVPHYLTSKATLLVMWPPPSSLYEVLFHCLYNISLSNFLVTLARTCMRDMLYVWMLDRVLLTNASLNQKQWYCYLPSLNLDGFGIFFLPILGSKKNHYTHFGCSYHRLFLASVRYTSRYVISADRFFIRVTEYIILWFLTDLLHSLV